MFKLVPQLVECIYDALRMRYQLQDVMAMPIGADGGSKGIHQCLTVVSFGEYQKTVVKRPPMIPMLYAKF